MNVLNRLFPRKEMLAPDLWHVGFTVMTEGKKARRACVCCKDHAMHTVRELTGNTQNEAMQLFDNAQERKAKQLGIDATIIVEPWRNSINRCMQCAGKDCLQMKLGEVIPERQKIETPTREEATPEQRVNIDHTNESL
jgi:ribosomal protein L44E